MPWQPSPRWLATMLALGACGHTDPALGTPDRWVGPWQHGTTIQLFPNPVALIGFSAAGDGVLIRRSESPRIRPPYGPPRRDAEESFLTFLPAGGGSGAWDWSDERPSQRDSINNMAAAAHRDRQLLVVEWTLPRNLNPRNFPILSHAELYLVDPADPGTRRQLRALFDEVNGAATVPPRSLNWLDSLQWSTPSRFLALGGWQQLQPDSPITRLGLVVGEIRADTTEMTVVDDLLGVERWSATADGAVLLQSGSDLLLRPAGPGGRTLLATIPAPEGHPLLAARCDVDACWAITGTDASPYPDWEIWRIDRGQGSVQLTRTVSPNPLGRPILPPTGDWAIVSFNGIPYRIDDVLPLR